MKAIILGAGQGKRLLPLTADEPKALLNVGGKRLIGWQVQEMVRCGVREFVVVTGFKADKVDRTIEALGQEHPDCAFRAVHNPFYTVADNLASCWMVRQEMEDDFLLLNGDTLFEAPVLRTLLGSPKAPITLAVDEKAHYDEDDMKVRRDGTRLMEIGKTLAPEVVDGESIGMLYFRDDGPGLFRTALERAMQETVALKQWYLSIIGQIALSHDVRTQLIAGHRWCEVDYPLDLERAYELVDSFDSAASSDAASAAGL